MQMASGWAGRATRGYGGGGRSRTSTGGEDPGGGGEDEGKPSMIVARADYMGQLGLSTVFFVESMRKVPKLPEAQVLIARHTHVHMSASPWVQKRIAEAVDVAWGEVTMSHLQYVTAYLCCPVTRPFLDSLRALGIRTPDNILIKRAPSPPRSMSLPDGLGRPPRRKHPRSQRGLQKNFSY